MTILSSDIKLFESERLTDQPDGGGRMTGNEIVDGQVNNLFPDISRLDRVYGRVNLRKGFTAVDTANADTYYGSHIIVDDAPDDPNVSVCLFSTGSHTDERASARDRIESYVVEGPESRMRPLGDQLSGQRTVTVYQREEDDLPEIGEVYVLSVEDAGEANDGEQQYVRVRDVAHEVQTFTEEVNSEFIDFDVRVITLSITTELRLDFPASAPTRDFGSKSTLVRSTQVASAASYYGIKPVTQALSQGDTQIQLPDIFHPLVPSTKSETPQVDVIAGATVVHEEQSGAETIEVQDAAHTARTDITLANRGLAYTKALIPLPAPGTTTIDFRALGQWYRISDRGDGKLEGDGSGTVNYSTGSVSVTLGANPDVGSALLFKWGTPLHYTDRAGSETAIDAPVVEIPMSQNAEPGSLTITWENPDQTQASASDDGAGAITGDASGTVIYTGTARGVTLQPSTLPDSSATYSLDYSTAASHSETFSPPSESGASFSLSTTPIKPGSVAISYALRQRVDTQAYMGYTTGGIYQTITQTVVDDGAGLLLLDGTQVGTVDYSTGAVSFDPRGTYTRQKYYATASDASYSQESLTEVWEQSTLIVADYFEDSATFSAANDSADAPDVTLHLTQTTQEIIAAGTLKFDFAGDTFIDRKGKLYRSVDANGAGILAGDIDYETGQATLIDYPSGDPILTVRTMLTKKAKWTTTELAFRTPGSPIKPLSLYLQVSDTGGNLLDDTADTNGVLDSAFMDGQIDTATGVVNVRFGQLVDDSSLTAEEKNEPWYDPGDVDGNGQIWQPLQVLPSTASFNAVVLSSLPLDADLLGLDPVRLPGDGKVPIFQPAGVVVVHNTQNEAMPSPLSAGQQVSLSRTDLALVWLEDDTGTEVDQAQYSVDLAAGTVTMASSGTFDLSPYTEPLQAYHRAEDMLLVTNRDIDGRLTVASGVSRDYPADTTYCSSALIFGDLQARATNFFSQESWDGNTWADSRQGNDTTASYNLAQYPIAIENQGAIKERWALDFTSTTEFDIVGETVGVIGTGTTGADVAPTNPETGTPYFQIQSEGFGSGWEVGNVIRFNTQAAAAPVWFARTILAGDATGDNDSFRVQNRGDAD